MFKFGKIFQNSATKSNGVTRIIVNPSDSGSRGCSEKAQNFVQDNEPYGNSLNLILKKAKFSGSNADVNDPFYSRQITDASITEVSPGDLVSDHPDGSANSTASDPAKAQATRDELNVLIGKLDQSLQQFAQNANEACSAASDYHAALFETATSLEAIRPVVEMTALSQLTRAMIERTRTVEADMRQREAEAASLRQSLPLAPADAQVDHLAATDNRTFAALLESEGRAARDAGEPLSIALCAIDEFKAISDGHGQDAGERVVQAIARVLQRVAGQNCRITRHADAAFALLFRGCMPEEAGARLNYAREKFAQRKLVDRKTRKAIGTITFSGGVANGLAYGGPREALTAADEALHMARDQGRNRILVAPASA